MAKHTLLPNHHLQTTTCLYFPFLLCVAVTTAEGCRKVVRERVLSDMLGTVVDSVGGGWKVLIMDSFTTRITSSALRMSDILDAGALWPRKQG